MIHSNINYFPLYGLSGWENQFVCICICLEAAKTQSIAFKFVFSNAASNQEKNPSADHEGVEIFFFPDESKAVKPVSTASSSTDLTGGNFADCEPTSGEYLSDEAANSLRFGGAEEEEKPIALVARELGDYSIEEEKRKLDASAAKKSQVCCNVVVHSMIILLKLRTLLRPLFLMNDTLESKVFAI